MSSSFSLRFCTIAACALAIYFVGIAARWGVLAVQEAKHGSIPFTLESALAFRYSQQAATGHVPWMDPAVGAPEGIRPFAALNILSPVLLGHAYRYVSGWIGISLEDFCGSATAPFFCLSLLAIFGCALACTRSLLASGFAALSYAILIPSVLRSTGQELMNENFALPLLWLHFLCTLLALERHRAGNLRAFQKYTVASALSLTASWILWDMIQVYLVGWVLVSALILAKPLGSSGTRFYATVHWAVLLLAAVTDPYLVNHGASTALPMMLCGAFVLTAWIWPQAGGRRISLFLLLAMLLGGLSHFVPDGRESYHHFAQLLWCKLKFANVKPADPALLPYEVRALWVPALHSSNWTRVVAMYGAPLLLWSLGVVLVAIRWLQGRAGVPEKISLCFGGFFLALAILFVRMEVFWAFFASLGLAFFVPRGKLLRAFWSGAWGLVLIVQALALIRQAPGMGRQVDYGSLKDVVGWVSQNTPEDSVLLASYSLSPSFSGYASRAIVLQPKYESANFRNKIRTFEEALMAAEEEAFYLLCKTWGVRYYVHSKGFYADHSLNSFRYLVGISQPSSKTNLAKFELNPQFLNHFRLLHQNDKYLVYGIVDNQDLEKSRFCLRQGRLRLAKGIPSAALRWFYRSLHLNPAEDQARLLLVRTHSLSGDVARARQEAMALFDRMQVRVLRRVHGAGLSIAAGQAVR